MADEIKIRISLNVTNGDFLENYAPGQIDVDQAAIGRYGGVQIIGTTEEILDFGDVSTAGYLFLRNLDATNYLEYGPESAGSGAAMVILGKLKPGEPALLRLSPGVVMRAKANTAAVKLDIRLFEN